MNCFPSIAMLLILSLLVFFHSEGTEAKRGCASFGHSCYGGMGKRASDLIDSNGEVMLNSVQDEDNPAFVFTGPRSSLPSRPYHKMTPEQYDDISKVIRQWIQSVRRGQELQDENNV